MTTCDFAQDLSAPSIEEQREREPALMQTLSQLALERFVISRIELFVQRGDLIEDLDLFRDETVRLEYRKRHPKILGRVEVGLQVERFTAPRQTIKLAAGHGLFDPFFDRAFYRHHREFRTV